MAISYAQSAHFQCHSCPINFDIPLWLIVDARERPDLWEYCRQGTIHTLTCANEHTTYFGMPLLLHDPERRRLIFSPPPYPLGQAEQHDMAEQLMAQLRANLPASLAGENYLLAAYIVPRSDLARAIDEAGSTGGDAATGGPQDNIAAITAEFARPPTPQEVPQRIRRAQEVLATLDPVADRSTRGWLQARLASLLAHNPGGNEADDIERSIEARHEALAVYTREEFPLDWARQLINLGNVYMRRVHGRREDNLTLAIDAYNQALTVLDERESAAEREHIQAALAYAYAERGAAPASPTASGAAERPAAAGGQQPEDESGPAADHFHMRPGETGIRMSAAIARAAEAGDFAGLVKLYRLMLQIVTPENALEQWMQLNLDLAQALMQTPEGSRADNFEEAIRLCELVLASVGREQDRDSWVSANYRLGLAYAMRPLGDPGQNIEKAIQALEATLDGLGEGFDGATLTEGSLSNVYYNLGVAYGSRVAGNPDDNAEHSIQALERARNLLRREDDPEQWAQINRNLGQAYGHRRQGDPATNFDNARQAYEAALSVWTRESHPDEWAKVQLDLSSLHLGRDLGPGQD